MTTFQPFFRILDKSDPKKIYYSIRRLDKGEVLVTSSNHNMIFEKETSTDVIVKLLIYKMANHISDDVSLTVDSDIGVAFDLCSSPGSNLMYENLAFVCNVVKHLEKVQEFSTH